MPIIAIHGPAGAGKDTIAQILGESLDKFRTTYFAHTLRTMLHTGGFCTWEEMTNPALKEIVLPRIGKSPRQLMQTLGTEWGRQLVQQDIWLSQTYNRIEDSGYPNWVIADVRFENEASYCRAQGARLWHITGRSREVSSHVSEKGVKFVEGYDEWVDNSGSMEQLRARVTEMVEARWSDERVVWKSSRGTPERFDLTPSELQQEPK